MTRRLVLLIAGSLVLWLLLAVPARYWWGDDTAVRAGVALLLCLVPAVVTMLVTEWALARSAEQQLAAVLGSTGARMFLVLGAAFGLYQWAPYFGAGSFLAWVVIFYLATLALEIGLLLSGRSAVKPSAGREEFEKIHGKPV